MYSENAKDEQDANLNLSCHDTLPLLKLDLKRSMIHSCAIARFRCCTVTRFELAVHDGIGKYQSNNRTL